MPIRFRHPWYAVFVAAALAIAAPNAARADSPIAWVGAWEAAMIRAPAPANGVAGAQQALLVKDQTLRELARVGLSGHAVRIVLDNRFGTAPVTFDAVSIGQETVGYLLSEASLTRVRFGGKAKVTLTPGARITSDPVTFPVTVGDVVGVSLHVAGTAEAGSWHPDPRNQMYLSGPGDQTMTPGLVGQTGLSGVAWLSRIDVQPAVPAQAIVALGDSITNGFRASQLVAWPEVLQDRLAARRCARSVINAGIDGNQVAAARGTFGMGEAMRDRVTVDALDVPGVSALLLLGGINDIGLSTMAAHADGEPTPTADALADPVIAADKTIFAAAHARGVRVYAGTVLPFAATTETYTAQGEAARQKINAWIRHAAGFDGVVDFDAVLRDPAHPERLQPLDDSGDNLHPSDAGYRAMAEAIPLALFHCH